MMSTEATPDDTTVKKSVIVRTSVEHAFEVFTERLDLWWPKSHHIGKADFADAKMEPKEGGRWYEIGADGSQCEWGRVLVWSPPRKVALSWQITPSWTFEPDPAHGSRVEVTFHDLGDGRTRVDLVHSELDRHGKGWEALRAAVESDGGWSGILAAYGASAEAS
jgi:uncharacterized protein YndB with AHSA1/START domain